MPMRDYRRSRFVAGLKIVLPLAALVVLSTLFLFSRNIDPSEALLYAEVDVDDLTRDPRVAGTRFAGVTDDGTAITLTAESVRARPGPQGDSLTAEDVFATLDAADGTRTTIAAAAAEADQAAGVMRLSGGVELTSPSGYALRTDNLAAALDRTLVESGGPVTAEGPPGRIEAGGMVLRAEAGMDADAQPQVLVFNKGVRLIYLPRTVE